MRRHGPVSGMEHSLAPMHACEDATTASWGPLSDCAAAAGLTTGSVITIVAVIVGLAAAGVGIWYWVQRRHA